MTSNDFEDEVWLLLQKLARYRPDRVELSHHPRVRLQNGETVVPDFDLMVVHAHERSFYYIECQDRKRSGKDLLHKILHMRTKGQRQRFVFVYRNQIPAETKRAMDAEGITNFDVAEFSLFLENVKTSLDRLPILDSKERAKGQEDAAMISDFQMPIQKSGLRAQGLNDPRWPPTIRPVDPRDLLR